MKKLMKFIFLSLLLISIVISLLFGYRDIPLDTLLAKYTSESSQFLSIDNMEVHYRDEGPRSDSIPIVLIHGTGSSLHTFEGWNTILKKERRVLSMDLPGYGLTGPFPDRDYSINNYLTFLYNFLGAVGVKKCVIGGNSLGGNIAWRFASKHPDMVERLVLIDASGYASMAQSTPVAFKLAQIPILKSLFLYLTPKFIARSSVENVYADKSKVTEELVDRYFELTLREGNRQAFVDRLAIDVDTSYQHKIKSIDKPTLLLWGEDDLLTPIEMAYKFQQDLTNDSLIILKNIGHVPMEEAPSKSIEVVVDFLEK